MSDPLSVAASIVSVAIPALHGAHLLLNDLRNIIDALQRDDVASAETALQSTRGIQDTEQDVLDQGVADLLSLMSFFDRGTG